MARGGQPINADVPESAASPAPEAAPKPTGSAPDAAAARKPEAKPGPEAASSPSPAAPEAAPAPPPARRRRPIPGAVRALAGLVILAVVFIAAAIVGGGGDGDKGAIPVADDRREAARTEPAPSAEPLPEGEAPDELGFPAAATANTTRVGGGDPASNAAAVALAAFPSGDDATRPQAVVLADAGDWRAAIAATVFMAEPLRAPLLLGEREGVPGPTAAALAALDPIGGRRSGGSAVILVGAVRPPDDRRSTRIAAGGAAAAAKIADLRDKLFGRPSPNLVIAPSTAPEFAMPAAAWAARSGDPVLYAGRASLPKATRRALGKRPRARVFVLGPSAAIGSEVVREVERLGHEVQRVSGEDPVSNAIALARYEAEGFGWDVNDPGHGFVVARADSPLDAAAAAALSASGTWGPLLLSDDAGTLPKPLRDYLLDVKPGYTTDPTRAFYNHVWLIGDEDAIGVGQQAEIDKLAELAKIGG